MLRFKVVRCFSYLLLFVLLSGLWGAQAVFAEGPEPTITSFTPIQALKGEKVVITGTGFTGATEVTFGETAVTSFTVDSDTRITAVIGKGGSGMAKVTTPGGTASKDGFHFLILELESKLAVISGESTDSFSAEVDIHYQVPEKTRFNLSINPPKDWIAYVLTSYPETKIAGLDLGPSEAFSSTERVNVNFRPLYSDVNPGDYITKMEVTAGELKTSIDLTARITDKYEMKLIPATGKYNTQATAGSDSHYIIKMTNSGTSPLENITFSADKPEGWTVKFNPEKVDGVVAGQSKDVDVIIKAPKGKTIAGDYMISLGATAKKGSSSEYIRVTVLTPSIWGWVGIIIVLAVIAGLALIFRQLGRR